MGERAAQLERPLGSLFARSLFWDRIFRSPKPRAVGGLFNNLGEDGGGRCRHFGVLTWFPG